MKSTIAIVEDEIELANNFKEALELRDYNVSLYQNRPDAELAFSEVLPDLVIIDIGLGNEHDGGFDLCASLRNRSATLPIIFLTARDDMFDEISGLRLGANDYLKKDTPREMLLVRIDTLMKRTRAMQQLPEDDEIMQRGLCTINLDRYTVSWNNEKIDISITEFWILKALAKHPGQVKSRQQLMDAAKITVEPETINTYIGRIRKHIKAVDPDASPITAEYSMGYRWSS
ncbi:MAG: response regulator [Gammaproteobacteria bacterium]|nr:response regulator [Gammaproteobacteria bacterium]